MGTRLGYFLLLLGGGIGLPFPEDLTLVGGGVLLLTGRTRAA